MTILEFQNSDGADEVRQVINANATELDARLTAADLLRGGWLEYANNGGAQAISGGGSVDLACNAHSAIETYAPTDVSGLWNPVTSRFDFSSLSNGDIVEIVMDMDATLTTAGQRLDIALEWGEGGSPGRMGVLAAHWASAGAKANVGVSCVLVMHGDNTRLNPARLIVSSDNPAEITCNFLRLHVWRRGGVAALA